MKTERFEIRLTAAEAAALNAVRVAMPGVPSRLKAVRALIAAARPGQTQVLPRRTASEKKSDIFRQSEVDPEYFSIDFDEDDVRKIKNAMKYDEHAREYPNYIIIEAIDKWTAQKEAEAEVARYRATADFGDDEIEF